MRKTKPILILFFSILFSGIYFLHLSIADEHDEMVSTAGRLDECCDEECYQDMCQNAVAGLSKDCKIKIKDDHEKLCADDEQRDCIIFAGEAGKSCRIDCDEGKISASCDEEDFDASQDAICRQARLDLKECKISFKLEEEDDDEDSCGC